VVDEITASDDVKLVQVSCHTDEGVMDLKNKACDALLAHRVDAKIKGSKINSIINRIHVSQPKPRDDLARLPFIPDAVRERKKYDKNDPNRRKLQRDVEAQEGGAGVFSVDLKSESLCCLTWMAR
jgi:nucleolar GTP-binding protein